MAKSPKEGKLIYHISALENVESIIENGLKPRKELKEFVDVADEDILIKRSNYNLGDFVPFHFFPSTPFSGSVQKGFPDSEFVYFAMDRISAKANKFRIIPKHPVNYNSEPLDWDDGFEVIDWQLMEKRDYSEYECKEVCMAEAICQGTIAIESIKFIFVKSEGTKERLNSLLKKHGKSRIFVNVSRFMFIHND